jgi:hypothetical protein
MIPRSEDLPQSAAGPNDVPTAPTLPSACCYINERLLASATRGDALFVHPHAQRTGGKTLRDRVLAAVFGAELVYGRFSVPGAKRWPRLAESDLEGFRAISDHFDFRPRRFARPCLPIALLRHPLYRAASLHGFVRKSEGHQLRALALNHDMEEFYRLGRDALPRYFRNLQCRSVCGVDDARVALDTILGHYLGVGFTEQIGAFGNALGSALGWPTLDIPARTPDAERYNDAITPGFRTMVLEDSAEDLALFEALTNGPPYRIAGRTAVRRARTSFKKAENAARAVASRYL